MGSIIDAFLFMSKRKPTQNSKLRSLAIPFIVTSVIYLGYLIFAVNLNSLVGKILLGAEIALFFNFLLFVFNNWKQHRITDSNEINKNDSVDVFIPLVNEPIDVIEKTVRAASKIKYNNYKLFILDDSKGGRSEVAALANKFGAKYINRPNNVNAKAGNLNYALKQSRGKYVLTIDADHIAQPDIITGLLGHFHDEKVAAVTTRQSYDLPEKDFNNDYLFFSHTQNGRNTEGVAIGVGNAIVYNREALESIGGFQTWNIVEDLYTTFVFNENGYRVVYVDKAYTKGLSPFDLRNIYKQRGTWALDTLRIFFRKNILFNRGLSFKAKLHYIESGLIYIMSGIVGPILMVLPALTLLLGLDVLKADLAPWYIAFRLPALITMIIFYTVLSRGYSFQQFWMGLFPIYLKAIFLAIKGEKPKYIVTSKEQNKTREWTLVLPQMSVLALGLISVFFYLSNGVIDLNFINNALWIVMSFVWFTPVIVRGFAKEMPVAKKQKRFSFIPRKAWIPAVSIFLILSAGTAFGFGLLNSQKIVDEWETRTAQAGDSIWNIYDNGEKSDSVIDVLKDLTIEKNEMEDNHLLEEGNNYLFLTEEAQTNYENSLEF